MKLTYVLILDHRGNKLLLKLRELSISDISDRSLCCILKLTVTISCHHHHFKLSAKYQQKNYMVFYGNTSANHRSVYLCRKSCL